MWVMETEIRSFSALVPHPSDQLLLRGILNFRRSAGRYRTGRLLLSGVRKDFREEVNDTSIES